MMQRICKFNKTDCIMNEEHCEWCRINTAGQPMFYLRPITYMTEAKGEIVTNMDNPIKQDMVNHPAHYNVNGMEVIDIIEGFDLPYHLGNVIKYILRAGRKWDTVEDLKKAEWYLHRYIEKLEKEQKNGE